MELASIIKMLQWRMMEFNLSTRNCSPPLNPAIHARALGIHARILGIHARALGVSALN